MHFWNFAIQDKRQVSKNFKKSFLRYIETTTGSVRNFAKCICCCSFQNVKMLNRKCQFPHLVSLNTWIAKLLSRLYIFIATPSPSTFWRLCYVMPPPPPPPTKYVGGGGWQPLFTENEKKCSAREVAIRKNRIDFLSFYFFPFIRFDAFPTFFLIWKLPILQQWKQSLYIF